MAFLCLLLNILSFFQFQIINMSKNTKSDSLVVNEEPKTTGSDLFIVDEAHKTVTKLLQNTLLTYEKEVHESLKIFDYKVKAIDIKLSRLTIAETEKRKNLRLQKNHLIFCQSLADKTENAKKELLVSLISSAENWRKMEECEIKRKIAKKKMMDEFWSFK